MSLTRQGIRCSQEAGSIAKVREIMSLLRFTSSCKVEGGIGRPCGIDPNDSWEDFQRGESMATIHNENVECGEMVLFS